MSRALCLVIPVAFVLGAIVWVGTTSTARIVPGTPSAVILTRYSGYDPIPARTTRIVDPVRVHLFVDILNRLSSPPPDLNRCPHDTLQYDYLQFVYGTRRWPVHMSLSGCMLVYSRGGRVSGLTSTMQLGPLHWSPVLWLDSIG